MIILTASLFFHFRFWINNKKLSKLDFESLKTLLIVSAYICFLKFNLMFGKLTEKVAIKLLLSFCCFLLFLRKRERDIGFICRMISDPHHDVKCALESLLAIKKADLLFAFIRHPIPTLPWLRMATRFLFILNETMRSLMMLTVIINSTIR